MGAPRTATGEEERGERTGLILSARQSRAFYRVFNAFCHFVAGRLGIGPLRTHPGGAIMEDDILDVCEAV